MPPPKASDIRAWAQQQGMTVSERGRLAQDVVAAYDQAHDNGRAAKVVKPVRAATAPAATSTPRPAAKTMPTPDRAEPEKPTSVATPSAPEGPDLEHRVFELEKQVLSLTQRLDAAVTAWTKRSRSFSLPKRR